MEEQGELCVYVHVLCKNSISQGVSEMDLTSVSLTGCLQGCRSRAFLTSPQTLTGELKSEKRVRGWLLGFWFWFFLGESSRGFCLSRIRIKEKKKTQNTMKSRRKKEERQKKKSKGSSPAPG